MDHREKAMELFRSGCNCSQSVLGAFCGDYGLDFDTAMRLSSSLGGGLGRLRELCGAVSGMCLAAGLARGFGAPCTDVEKGAHYARVQRLVEAFRRENGSIVCRELLGLAPGASSPVPTPRTADFYQKRPCAELVGCAAALLEQELADD